MRSSAHISTTSSWWQIRAQVALSRFWHMKMNPRLSLRSLRFRLLTVLLFMLALGARPARMVASDPGGGGDWPMWGGTPDRNMVSNMKGLPINWDVKTKKNVRWVANLGSQSYGRAVDANGMVFVGTNNEAPRDPKKPGDRGGPTAVREADWQ